MNLCSRPRALLGSVLVAGLLHGCGGGGGSSAVAPPAPPPASPPPPPTVPSPNAPPVLGANAFSTAEDTELAGALTSTDPDGDAPSFARAGDPVHGTLVAFGADGRFTYRPNADYAGPDSFAITVADGRGGVTTGVVTIAVTPVNDPPRALRDAIATTFAGGASLAVLANDIDPDGDPLSITIEEALPIGSTTVNADRTVRLSLPPGFAGVTRLRYRATDPAGASSVADAVVYVDVPRHRVAYVADAAPGAAELFLSDFVDSVQVTQASAGALRLDHWVVAEDGSLVAYTRADPAARSATQELWYVRLENGRPGVPLRVPMPPATRLVAWDPASGDWPRPPVAVARDGRWLAFVAPSTAAGAPTGSDLWLVDTAAATPVPARVGGLEHAYTHVPTFAPGGRLYFLGSATAVADGSALYRVEPGSPGAPVRVSGPQVPGQVSLFHRIDRAETRLLLAGQRDGVPGIFLAGAAGPGTESRLTSDVGASVRAGQFTWPPSLARVAYSWSPDAAPGSPRISVVDVAPGAAPSVVVPAGPVSAPISRIAELRPDGAAVLFGRLGGGASGFGRLIERELASGTETEVAAVGPGHYDATGNHVLVPSTRAVHSRGAFGTPTTVALDGAALVLLPVREDFGPSALAGTLGGVPALVNIAAPGVPLRLSTLSQSPAPPGWARAGYATVPWP